MQLRDYQLQAYNDIRRELACHTGVCCVLPCRSGKSYIMKLIVDNACKKGNNVLVLAHRNLLIEQHKELIKNCRIASVFTEVNHLGKNGKVDLIIIDEAHISGCDSYQKVCEYYKCKRILFTATAERLDGKPLNLADTIINGISADELIKLGHISPYNLYAPKLNFNLSNVSMSGNDFNNTQLSEVMLDKKIYGDIIKYYTLYAKDKQAIAYCTNIAHSQSICELFNSNGISAVEMNAGTPEKTRNQIMDDFKTSKFKILCNCNLISEGITVPNCDCCLLLRPTQSETLYIQQACRCLTPVKGKVATIIDFVGNCYTHGMPTEKRIYTLNATRRTQNASREPDILVRQCKSCLRVYSGTSR
ncbi:MAG: DEAD/DEAH box helicase, partial [Clostridia bacterium]|nr:DEAD/DEAH box helicase [Clostridia bacterium]